MKLNRVWSALILFSMVILAWFLLYLEFRNSSLKEILGWLVVTIALMALGVLSAKFPAIKRLLDSVLSGYLRFTLWYFLFFLPVLPFRWLNEVVSSSLPTWLQVLVFILWGACLIGAIWVLILEKNRVRLFGGLRKKVGTAAPFAYSFNLMWIAIFFFSSVTYTLVHSGVLGWAGSAAQNITPGAIMDFYFWHFLDAVPVFKITETLRWKEPLTYDGGSIGFLLLLFKIVVISPIIGAFIWYWKHIGTGSDETTGKVASETQAQETSPETG